ncbi:uncharacterized protein LOC135240381 isoform X1 [Anguilla rostrata]|uniref:uncharacterized protein LOC135240381 isoform X1 n=1 Tax=Anguilla rostrata TaxID=7938 RepID=UPI0030D36791
MPVPVGWVLIGLCFGTSVLAETEAEAELSRCGLSFYRRTPPAGFGGQLRARCHGPGAGRPVASLHSEACDVTVLSAFCLHAEWTGAAGHDQEDDVETEKDTGDAQTGGEEEDESQSDEEGLPVTMPALLRRGGYDIYASSDTPADSWDALVTELVQNNIHPQCRSLGGDLYVLAGRGGAGELEQGCEVGLFWSAMCCADPDGEAVFSLGVVKGREEEARVLDVKGLEEAVGVGGVFSGGCGEADGGEGGGDVTLAGFQNALRQIVGMHNADTQAESSDTLAESATQPDAVDELAESLLAESAATQSADAPSEEAEGESAVVQSRRSAPPSAHEEPDGDGAAPEVSEEPQGNSTALYLLSCSLWLLSAPLRPVVSTLTQIPGQVTHVIQEDLSVLSALPGVTLSLAYNVAADAACGAVSAAGLAGRAGAACASQLYSCTSPLVGALLSACQDGVVGVGTLTWDGVGIAGGVANRAWSVSRYVGGRAWDQGTDFLWAVLSELGSQSTQAGGGLGKLALKGGNGVVNTVCMAGRVVGGTLSVAVETVKEAFGGD